MEYMLTFHTLNVYVDKTQPRQFKFTFKGDIHGWDDKRMKEWLYNWMYHIYIQV